MAENKNASEKKFSMVLRSIGEHAASQRMLLYPYSKVDDTIDGKTVHSCGLIRIPLMDEDMVSEARTIIGKHGQEKRVVDIYLAFPTYMTFYNREFVFLDNDHVEKTNRGHYGELVPVEEIVKNMAAGKKFVDRARRLWAAQEEAERNKEYMKHHVPQISAEEAKALGDDIPSYSFANE